MFDVSFGELLLILIVGLLVFGPEKLPHAVRTASLWMGRIRRSFNQMRAEIEREVGVEEFKRDLHNQQILDSLREVKDDLTGAQRDADKLAYDLDRSIRENVLVEQTPEKDSAHAAIPNDDFKHSDSSAAAQALEAQTHDIEHSVQAQNSEPAQLAAHTADDKTAQRPS